jgi:uncharacterized protein with gpF-like domain
MTHKEQHNWWLTFSKFQLSREKTWSAVLFKNLQAQIAPTIAIVKDHGIQSAISNLDMNIPMDKLGATIKNIYIDAGSVFGGKSYQVVKKQGEQKSLMPIGYNEQLINDIIQYYNLYILSKAVVPISETTKEYVLQRLIEAQQNGDSIQDVVDSLENTDITRARARLIARTETNKSANWAAVWGAKKTGYQTNKIWISARDNRTRRIPRNEFDHLQMNGQTVDMNEPFKVPNRSGGYQDMMQPGDPNGSAADVCRCRCTVGFKVLRDHAGRPLRN